MKVPISIPEGLEVTPDEEWEKYWAEYEHKLLYGDGSTPLPMGILNVTGYTLNHNEQSTIQRTPGNPEPQTKPTNR